MPTLPKIEKKRRSERHGKDKRIRDLVYNTSTWQRMRKAKLMENPLCECCGRALATQVHHVTKISSADRDEDILELGFNFSNLQSLCDDCHERIHGKKY